MLLRNINRRGEAVRCGEAEPREALILALPDDTPLTLAGRITLSVGRTGLAARLVLPIVVSTSPGFRAALPRGRGVGTSGRRSPSPPLSWTPSRYAGNPSAVLSPTLEMLLAAQRRPLRGGRDQGAG